MDATNQDRDHLRVLSIFHYVLAGIIALFALLPVIHMVVGIAILVGTMADPARPQPPRAMGLVFVLVALVFMALLWGLAVAVFLAGRWLSVQRAYNYCFAIACIECILIPLGTVLGVFTILVLSRPSVKRLFGPPPPAPAGP